MRRWAYPHEGGHILMRRWAYPQRRWAYPREWANPRNLGGHILIKVGKSSHDYNPNPNPNPNPNLNPNPNPNYIHCRRICPPLNLFFFQMQLLSIDLSLSGANVGFLVF